MAAIDTYIEQIRSALYGEEVRSSIVNALLQCYEDQAEGVIPTVTVTELENGVRVTITAGPISKSFDIYNGFRTEFSVQQFTSSSVTVAAGASGSSDIQITYPTGYQFVGVLGTYATGGVVQTYTNAGSIIDGGNATVTYENNTNSSQTVTLGATVLFMKTMTESAGSAVIRDSAWPVGSIYMSVNNTNPATLFGGTWVQLENRFLLGAGSSYTAGDTGGNETHYHEAQGNLRAAIGAVNNSPNMIGYQAANPRPNDQGPATTNAYTVQGTHIGGTTTFNHYTPVYGVTKEESSMPPYLVVYMWQRTA